MKDNILVERFQKLAGIVPPPNQVQSPVNTPDEKRVSSMIEINPSMKKALMAINQPMELDGLFEIILKNCNIKDVQKSIVRGALNKAMNTIAPNVETISTQG